MHLKTLFNGAIIFSLILGLTVSVASMKEVAPINSRGAQNSSVSPLVRPIQGPTLIKNVKPALPVRIKIPKLKVDAELESVGLTAQGAVGIPKGPTKAAWYNKSPRPGDTGSSVITGHYGVWKNGAQTVFNKLHTLRKGDRLSVKNNAGVTTTFVVRELRLYGKNDKAVDVFRSSDGKAHLNLITCEGVWNEAQKSYSKRLVVFTDKVPE